MSALSGIDIALWDLKGECEMRSKLLHTWKLDQLLTTRIARKLGVPIYELLGGRLREKIKVYAWIGGDRPDQVKEQAYVNLPDLHTQSS